MFFEKESWHVVRLLSRVARIDYKPCNSTYFDEQSLRDRWIILVTISRSHCSIFIFVCHKTYSWITSAHSRDNACTAHNNVHIPQENNSSPSMVNIMSKQTSTSIRRRKVCTNECMRITAFLFYSLPYSHLYIMEWIKLAALSLSSLLLVARVIDDELLSSLSSRRVLVLLLILPLPLATASKASMPSRRCRSLWMLPVLWLLLMLVAEEEFLFLSLRPLRVESLSAFNFDDDDLLLMFPSYSADAGMEALSFLSLLEYLLLRLMLTLPLLLWRWLFSPNCACCPLSPCDCCQRCCYLLRRRKLYFFRSGCFV